MPEQHSDDTALVQLQQQFQQMAGQFDRLRQQMADVHGESNQSSRQLALLIEQITDADRADGLLERVADMATALDATQSQLEALTERTARQEQLERLVEVVAGQSQLDEFNDNLKKLTRTQFKSNTLVESKSEQVQQALNTLRALATQREEVQQQRSAQFDEQLTEAHHAGRAEFAAELLPALDSLELALTNGNDLLTRQKQRVEQLIARAPAAATTTPQPVVPSTPPPSFLQRLFGTTDVPSPPPPPPSAPSALPLLQEFSDATEQAITAWLDGLTLVRGRLTALLGTVEIEPIDALHQPFDPTLHVAVESTPRDDVEPNTVVRVLRQGYRRHDRIIRYAEVVVARRATS